MLLGKVDELYLVQCDNKRAARLEGLVEVAQKVRSETGRIDKAATRIDAGKVAVLAGGSVEETVRQVMARASEDDVVLICGSFYIMSEARRALGYHDCTDPAS